MIPKIKNARPLDNFILHITFDDGKEVFYDVKEDIASISSYAKLKSSYRLFQQVQIDPSRTVLYWNDEIDLPSDILYEYGKEIQ